MYKINYSINNLLYGGSNISWATEEHKKSIISSKQPNEEYCDLITDVLVSNNEGRNNLGIGFITIEGTEYFLKYSKNLINEFITGYYLSQLKNIYPYFLDVHSVLKCPYSSDRTKNKLQEGQIMIVDKGTETIYQYLNRKTKEYLQRLIPDLETKINKLDSDIENLLNEELTEEQKVMYEWNLKKDIGSEKYNAIKSKIEIFIKEFYTSLSSEIIQFQTDFIPLFIKNYKVIIDSFLLVDVVTLNQYHDYITDKKSDNFMIKTEPYVDGKTHIDFQFGPDGKKYKVKNICEWNDGKEFCFLYPVDFGSSGDIGNSTKLSPELSTFFYNSWIWHYCRSSLYSDNNNTSFESGNILKLNPNKIEIHFSKFNYNINISDLFSDLFEKYNLFKIRIVNPLKLFFSGLTSNDNYQQIMNEIKQLTQKEGINTKQDFRFQMTTTKAFNITTLEEAVHILDILLNGTTVIYDETTHEYRSYSSGLGFLDNNGLQQIYYPNIENSYKTFTIPINI